MRRQAIASFGLQPLVVVVIHCYLLAHREALAGSFEELGWVVFAQTFPLTLNRAAVAASSRLVVWWGVSGSHVQGLVATGYVRMFPWLWFRNGSCLLTCIDFVQYCEWHRRRRSAIFLLPNHLLLASAHLSRSCAATSQPS